MLGSIPSYTQLGMASLLPHKTLTFDDHDGFVYADGMYSQGTDNRTKILQARHPGSIAISAEDFLKMNAKAEGREFVKDYQVLYIYSNGIDKVGDDRISEHKVFTATEDEFEYVKRIMKQVANMNGTNMFITSDHGYLYQHNRLEESDFTEFDAEGDIYRSAKRFILGKNLAGSPAFKKFVGASAGFADETEVLLPKSINRVKMPGSGNRYVHGGASLQEIVLPMIEVAKKRKSDITHVDVEVLGAGTNITSNQFGVKFYQQQPVAEKVLARQLKAGFYTAAGKLVSDVTTLTFDSTDADAQAREVRYTFSFGSDATQYNNQDVSLKLEELIEGTTQYRLYKQYKYRMLISFGSEFDEF